MADFTKNKKKYCTEDLAELPRRFPPTHSLVNLRDSCQFSKALVNWYRDHQKDSETQNSRICSEFPGNVNSKVHPKLCNSLPNPQRRKKEYRRDRCKANTKRNNELSFFVEETEQLKINTNNSLQENTQKAQCQDTNAAVRAASKVLQNTGNAIFKFKHFADPEEVVLEYINVHIYNRARLAKVDTEKLSASMIALQNIRKEATAEFDETEADKSLKVVHAGEKTILHSDKLSTNVHKLEKRLPTIKNSERAIATNNFVFEFGALDASSSQNSRHYHIPTFELKLMEEKSGVLDTSQKSVSLLPKLNHSKLQAVNMQNAETNDIFGKRILPDIPRGKNPSHRKKEMEKSQSGVDRKKLGFDIDARGADVKSNWQLLKQKRNWTRGKDRTSSQQTKRLYDTLEKMSTEMYGINKPRMDSEIDNYPCRGGYKSLQKITEVDDNRESGETGNTLVLAKRMPDTSKEIEALKYLRERIQGRTDFGKKVGKSNDKSSSKNVRLKNRNDINSGSASNVPSNVSFKKNPLNRETVGSKSEVEKYLEKYSLRLDDEISNSHGEKTVPYPSSETVADMLARLNIHDVGFHINAEKKKASTNAGTSPRKCEDTQISTYQTSNSPLISKTGGRREAKLSEKVTSATQNQNIITKNGLEIREVEPLRVKEEDRKLCTVEQSSGTNKTERTAIQNNNAFVKMSLNHLEGKIPKQLCSQILRSDFLKKDLSFRAGDFFRGSLNFKNILNSGSRLIFSIDNNSGHDSLLRDKWLKKKIQRVIAGGVGAGSEDEENPQKIVKKSKAERDFEKLHEIVDKKSYERNGTGKPRQSFARKFLELQNEILMNPRLQAILPRLVDGLAKFSEKKTR